MMNNKSDLVHSPLLCNFLKFASAGVNARVTFENI